MVTRSAAESKRPHCVDCEFDLSESMNWVCSARLYRTCLFALGIFLW